MFFCVSVILLVNISIVAKFSWEIESMRDIYVCDIFLHVKIYLMYFYWSHFFDVHFSYREVFMCQVLGGL